MQSATKSRPRGVTIAATVNIIGGLAGLMFGIGFILQDAVLQSGFGIELGAAFVPLGIVSFIVAYGLLKGRRWTWTATLVLSIISMMWYAFTVAIIPSNGGRILGVIIAAVTIYFLYRPHVKAYLGKEVG
jgi:hypothetical protein